MDTPEKVAREYGALYKAAKATRCRDLLLLTSDGRPPSESWRPPGQAVQVQAIWKWLLEA
jgi:hypothetical protein